MKLSEIKDLFTGQLSVKAFKERNRGELDSFSSLHYKKGSSMPIYLQEDIDSLEINHLHLLKLCNLYLEGGLNRFELSYIADALLLSEKVKLIDDSIMDDLETMTDFTINGEFTKEVAQNIIAKHRL